MTNLSALPNPTSGSRPSYKQFGTSGTRIFGGRIHDIEQNADLQGRDAVVAFEGMLRTDAVIAACADALISTQLTAEWQFTLPDGAPPLALKARDYLSEAFGFNGSRGYIKGGWKGFLRTALRYQLTGYRYAEEVYKPDAGKVWIDFADREPSAHWTWNLTPDGRELASVTQDWTYASGSLAERRPIPARKMVLLTHQRTGQNYEGCGLLRPLHFPSLLKAHAMRQIGIGVERWANPTPRITIDKTALGEQGIQDADFDAILAGIEEAAENYTSGEASYVKDVRGIALSLFGDRAFDVSQPNAIIQLCDNQTLLRFGLQFLALGINTSGSRAVGEIQISHFRQLALDGLQLVADVIGGDDLPGQGTIARLMKWNFPSLDPKFYPRLTHGRLDPGPVLALADVLPGLVQSKVLTPDNDLENQVRQGLAAPPLPEQHERDPEEREVPV